MLLTKPERIFNRDCLQKKEKEKKKDSHYELGKDYKTKEGRWTWLV